MKVETHFYVLGQRLTLTQMRELFQSLGATLGELPNPSGVAALGECPGAPSGVGSPEQATRQPSNQVSTDPAMLAHGTVIKPLVKGNTDAIIRLHPDVVAHALQHLHPGHMIGVRVPGGDVGPVPVVIPEGFALGVDARIMARMVPSTDAPTCS